ncbi:MAG: trypsin-like serine protease [Pseudomonadota bacterium]
MDAEPVENSQDRIINGTDVGLDVIGVAKVMLDGGTRYCTGTMLRPNWVLTAAHCVNTTATAGGGQPLITPYSRFTVKLNGLNTKAATAINIYEHPDSTVDVALIRLSSPPDDFSGQPFHVSKPLYRGSSVGLRGSVLDIRGWGENTASCAANGSGATGTGGGTLRKGTAVVSGWDGTAFFMSSIPGVNQIQWHGDSGSSPYQYVQNRPRPTGVLSYGFCVSNSVTRQDVIGGERYRDWANGIIGNAPSFGSPSGIELGEGHAGDTAIFYRGPTDSHLKLLSSYWSQKDYTTAFGAPTVSSGVALYTRAEDSSTGVVYRHDTSSSNRSIYEVRVLASGVKVTNLVGPNSGFGNDELTASSSTPSVLVRGSAFGGANLESGDVSVIYGNLWGGISEMKWRPLLSSWQHNVISRDGTVDQQSGPQTYIRADGYNAIVYRSTTGHIMELTSFGAGAWSVPRDLTQATGAPLAAVGSPRPYTRPDGYSIVLFIDTTGKIIELSLNSLTGRWNPAGNLSAATQPPITFPVKAVFPFVRNVDQVPTIVIQSFSTDISIAELPSGGPWTFTNLTSALGLPPATGQYGTVNRPDGYADILFTNQSNNHIMDLAEGISFAWQLGDVTQVAGGNP